MKLTAAIKFLTCAINPPQTYKKYLQNRFYKLFIGNPQAPNSHFPLINQNFRHFQKGQSPILQPNNTFNQQIFEEHFIRYEHFNEHQTVHEEETESCLSTKQTNPSEPSIELDTIDSLQFEANSPIQDKLVSKRLTSIDAECMSIFDGHGGNALAQYASKKVNELIDSYLYTHLSKELPQLEEQKNIDMIKSAIQWAYQQIQDSFCDLLQQQYKTGNKDIIKIGTCAITCVIWKNHLISANCGDSQAIIVYKDETGLCFFKANQQLNTSNQNQLTRIEKEFKDIDDNVLVKSKLNQKIYIKGILQPTRTLGDYYLKKQKYFHKVHKASKTQFKGPYIKHSPVFNIIRIKSNFRYLILASDGLWDFATKKQILKVVENYHSLAQQSSIPISVQQLNKAYVQKQSTQPIKKLTEYLRDHVLEKCAKRKKKSKDQLIQIPPGDRRNFCDDISIITVSFREDII